MGRQINFYFCADDDAILADFLSGKNLSCIPRMNPTAVPDVTQIGDAMDLDVKLIPASYADYITGKLGTPNNHFWHLYEDGLYIDWQRCKANTTKHDRYVGPAVYSQSGRFYFPTLGQDAAPDATTQAVYSELTKVMNSIIRKVKTHSSHRAGPYYVGRHLADRVLSENAVLMAGNGVTELTLA